MDAMSEARSPLREARSPPEGKNPLRLAIVGPGRAGKDETAIWMNGHTTLRYGISTSQVIAPVVAAKLGISAAEAFGRRHSDRNLWRATGDEMRAHDPARLAREVLRTGDLVVGVRSRREMEAVIAEGLVSLVIWLDRDVPEDPTLEFGPELADVVIENRSSLASLHARLRRLSYCLGILRPAPVTFPCQG